MNKLGLTLYLFLFLSALGLARSRASNPYQSSGAPRSPGANTDITQPGGAPPTAPAASNAERDINLMKKIKEVIMLDGTLSANAKNIKVITRNSEVILQGMVDSEQERDAVLAKVHEVSGAVTVDNQLKVRSAAEGK